MDFDLGNAADVAELKTLLADNRLSQAMWIFGLVLAIYDWVINLDDEVTHYWKLPWTRNKLLYLFIRFFFIGAAIVFITVFTRPLIPTELCNALALLLTIMAIPQHIAWATIQVLRVLALYGGSRKVLHFLAACATVQVVSAAVIIVYAGQGFKTVVGPPELLGCTLNSRTIPSWIWTFWAPAIAFETILLLMIGNRVVPYVIDGGARSYMRPQDRSYSVMELFLRDSIIYYLWNTGTHLAALLMWKFARPSLIEGIIAFVWSAQCVGGSHILLNIRRELLYGGPATIPSFVMVARSTDTAQTLHRTPQSTLKKLDQKFDVETPVGSTYELEAMPLALPKLHLTPGTPSEVPSPPITNTAPSYNTSSLYSSELRFAPVESQQAPAQDSLAPSPSRSRRTSDWSETSQTPTYWVDTDEEYMPRAV